MLKHTVFTALAAAAVSTSALVVPAMLTPAAAQASLNVVIGTPPPAPVYEVVPRRAPATSGRPATIAGRAAAMSGHRAAGCPSAPATAGSPTAGITVRTAGIMWPADWDRNGNGVPDRYEHRADNRGLGDRDHDGVPNRYDSRPDNPYRR